MNLQIRKATLDDLDRLMEIFEEARRFMCRTGNPNQWINGYPQRELIQEEIEASHCYVCNERRKSSGYLLFHSGTRSDVCTH